MKKLRYLFLITMTCGTLAATPHKATKNDEGFGTFCKQFASAFIIHKTIDIVISKYAKRACIAWPIVTIGGVLLAQEATNTIHQKISEESYQKTHFFAGLLAWCTT